MTSFPPEAKEGNSQGGPSGLRRGSADTAFSFPLSH